MALWRWQFAMVADAATARTNDSLVSMEMNFGFELIPQFVVFRSLHATTKQLNLLDSGKSGNGVAAETMWTAVASTVAQTHQSQRSSVL